MKISLLSANQNKNNQKPSFKGADFFLPIKKIPGMVCAVCGRPTLDIDLYVKTISPICKSLAYAIEKGAYSERYQKAYPIVFAKLQEWAELYPQMSIDEIIEKNQGLYSELKRTVAQALDETLVDTSSTGMAYHDRKVSALFFDTIEMGRSYMKSSSVVMKQLSKLRFLFDSVSEDVMNTSFKVKREVFEQLEKYARKYPRKSLSEIIKMPIIADFHRMKNLLQRTDMREELDYRFDNILLLIKEKKPKAVEYFKELKEEVLEMYEQEPDEKARVYNTEKIYKTALKEHGCESLEDKVLEELGKIPRTFVTKDSFFYAANNRNYSDGKIVDSLFRGFLASEDHIVSLSHGGSDHCENKVVMHIGCNDIKSSKPFLSFLKYHPEMLKNTQTQIDLIVENILAGKLPDNLRAHPIRNAEALYNASEGKMVINLDKYCSESINESQKRVGANEDSIDKLQEERAAITASIKNLKDQNYSEGEFQKRLKRYADRHKKST